MPYLAHDGVRLHYDLHGDPADRPPLLLSHGFRASGRMWGRNLAALARDREVLTWDLRGHARSDAPDDPAAYGVEQSVGDMVALLDVLGTTRVVLGGMSLGGYLSLVFHARHPDHVAALVLVDTGPGFRSDASREQWNGFAERTAQALERDGSAALPASPEVDEHPAAHGLAHTARRVMAQRNTLVIDSLERSGHIARRRNPSDRREYALQTNARGRALLAKAEKAIIAAEADTVQGLSAGELRQLLALLGRIAGPSAGDGLATEDQVRQALGR